VAKIEDPQQQKCSLCGVETVCVEISVTTGGDPGLFSVGENYWICQICAQTPIGDLIEKAFNDRDARPQFPPMPS
jgi:hypothetical protein